MAATSAATSRAKGVLDLRPKGLTPERIEEEVAKLGDFRIGQTIEVRRKPSSKALKAKVLKVDENTGDMTVRILNPVVRPARILPSQADGSIDRVVNRSAASRRQQLKH